MEISVSKRGSLGGISIESKRADSSLETIPRKLGNLFAFHTVLYKEFALVLGLVPDYNRGEKRHPNFQKRGKMVSPIYPVQDKLSPIAFGWSF